MLLHQRLVDTIEICYREAGEGKHFLPIGRGVLLIYNIMDEVEYSERGTRLISNGGGVNPLRQILANCIDFDRVVVEQVERRAAETPQWAKVIKAAGIRASVMPIASDVRRFADSLRDVPADSDVPAATAAPTPSSATSRNADDPSHRHVTVIDRAWAWRSWPPSPWISLATPEPLMVSPAAEPTKAAAARRKASRCSATT